MSKPTSAELLNLREGDGILLDDGRIREVQGVDKYDKNGKCVETEENWITYDDIAQIIYKAPEPEPIPAREPMTPAEAAYIAQHMQAESNTAATANIPSFFYKSEPAPRKAISIAINLGKTDEDDLIFALANDGTIFMGPARASGGQFSWIQVPSLPQS